MLYELIRPALFRLDPEIAHHLTLAGLQALARLGGLNPLRRAPTGRPREVMGLVFPNPVGLAAGLDKSGDCLEGLAALGFGFIEVGTVTPRPQAGNPVPRLFRLEEAEAIVNRMGFNNKGVDHLVRRIESSRYRGILGINIGKNRDTPVERALEDYLEGLRKVYALASYVTINVSSPNTPGLRALQAGESLEPLLAGLVAERDALTRRQGRRVPLAVKIAPDLTPEQLEEIAALLLRFGLDAVIATNTTVSRRGVEGLPHSGELGGLSGRPLLGPSTEVVRRLAEAVGGRLPIIACGGIFSGSDAVAKFEAGASLVQVYTGFIYRGPALLAEIGRAVAAL